MVEAVLVVHGGAGRLHSRQLATPRRREYEAGLRAALEAGRAVLHASGGALPAVVAAVRVLEDDPLFNAGHGAVLCDTGEVELSAGVMDGQGRAGAVAGVRHLRHPVEAALALLDEEPVLLAGSAADEFGRERGLAWLDPARFVTPQRRQQWQRQRRRGGVAVDHDAKGTVGAVARDANGALAAATSTGGLANQRAGRIGDTPSIGAGTWADDTTCAVSATGTGEVFMRLAFARRVADLIELAGLPLDQACDQALAEVARASGVGGCIAVDAGGHMALPFNSPHMLRGWIRGSAKAQVRLV